LTGEILRFHLSRPRDSPSRAKLWRIVHAADLKVP
jgi:hypothetical protein